jgi:hypothetical protein
MEALSAQVSWPGWRVSAQAKQKTGNVTTAFWLSSFGSNAIGVARILVRASGGLAYLGSAIV